MCLKSMRETNCSGVRSATSFQTGLPTDLAQRSQTAFTYRGERQVNHSFLGAQPAQLTVSGEGAPEAAHVGDDLLQRASDDERPECFDRLDADLVAAADRERESVAGQPLGMIRRQNDVGCRVVGVGVHGIRPVEKYRSRKAQIVGFKV